MNRLKACQLLAALLLAGALLPAALAQEIVEGREYKPIVPAQPPAASDKIEVIEFFSYA